MSVNEEIYAKFLETDRTVHEHYSDMRVKLEEILKSHRREKSDL